MKTQLEILIDRQVEESQRDAFMQDLKEFVSLLNRWELSQLKKGFKNINMKTTLITLIALFSLQLASCQQKTLKYYNTKSWDSLLSLKNIAVTENTTLTANLATSNQTINALKTQNNQLLSLNDAISLQNEYLKNKYDSLFSAGVCLYDADTLIVLTDTAYYQIGDNNLIIKVNKQGNYTKVSVLDADSNRIYITKRTSDLDFWVQSALFTRFSSHLDLR